MAGKKSPRRQAAPRGGPDLAAARRAFSDLCVTIAALRDPKHGCPWDLEQDHRTLRRFMIEEAYEAAEAMTDGDPAAICDELGDVLLQVVLNAQVALDQGKFSIADVARAIDAKMRRRHPHVFGDEAERGSLKTPGAVRSNWEQIKRGERTPGGGKTTTAKGGGAFGDARAKRPATLQAQKIGKIAARVRFDWQDADEVFAQVKSEVDELTRELARPRRNLGRVADEVGDVYFSLAQLCRHLGLDPEVVSLDANRKFLRRFAGLERLAAERSIELEDAPRDELERLWRAVKDRERSRGRRKS